MPHMFHFVTCSLFATISQLWLKLLNSVLVYRFAQTSLFTVNGRPGEI